jgi:hypothetical protein
VKSHSTARAVREKEEWDYWRIIDRIDGGEDLGRDGY